MLCYALEVSHVCVYDTRGGRVVIASVVSRVPVVAVCLSLYCCLLINILIIFAKLNESADVSMCRSTDIRQWYCLRMANKDRPTTDMIASSHSTVLSSSTPDTSNSKQAQIRYRGGVVGGSLPCLTSPQDCQKCHKFWGSLIDKIFTVCPWIY